MRTQVSQRAYRILTTGLIEGMPVFQNIDLPLDRDAIGASTSEYFQAPPLSGLRIQSFLLLAAYRKTSLHPQYWIWSPPSILNRLVCITTPVPIVTQSADPPPSALDFRLNFGRTNHRNKYKFLPRTTGCPDVFEPLHLRNLNRQDVAQMSRSTWGGLFAPTKSSQAIVSIQLSQLESHGDSNDQLAGTSRSSLHLGAYFFSSFSKAQRCYRSCMN
ncbi:hypothetical protein BDR05DRAFT_730434 [Suillus weaverae]|nr:hypothetical protein BDR05DRAFT_730434 [Suillus weaverae]